MNRSSHRPPAWAGLTAQAPTLVEADPGLAQQVVAALGVDGAVRQIANAGGGGSVFLKFEPKQGPPLFLKLIGEHRADELADAELVAQWLKSGGVNVVTASRNTKLDDGRALWAYAFHHGRPPLPTVPDLSVIGAELGRLHQRLARHPSTAQWRLRTDKRLSRLSEIRESLATGALQAGPAPARLMGLARDPAIEFHPERDRHGAGRVPLHGDLNLFNLLIEDDRCTFLDFEDVCHSVLPAVVDLATVYERVVLVNPQAGDNQARLSALLGAYEASTGTNIDAHSIPATLRGLALRALCTLADIDPCARDEQEWNKFFHLLDLAATLPH